MKISNLKIRKKSLGALAASVVVIASLTACNQQVIDLNKSFNVVIEPNGDCISVVGITNYTDYAGTQVQFVTNSGLVILSSTDSAQLAKFYNPDALTDYTEALVNDGQKIISFDDIQGSKISFDPKDWNKNIIDLQKEFNKAIILTDGSATIVNLDTWTTYKKDDKVQITLEDGTCILTELRNIKLVDDTNAEENSLENYALSLVGDEEKITYLDTDSKSMK